MSKSLVLAEKPSVAKEIARVLGCRGGGKGYISGDKYIVTWALGHLVTLADPDVYDKSLEKWSMDSLPMLPEKMKLVTIKEVNHQFRVVKELLNRQDVSQIIIATDAGREGELVARWILIKAGCKKPTKRLWISSQTDKAVRDGFNKLQPGRDYDNLYLSAKARSEADWLVGLNVTRALTCRFGAQLSAGRVQTPTLAMIVDREREIRGFRPKDVYSIRAKFDGFNAMWMKKGGSSQLYDEDEAKRILDKFSSSKVFSAVEVTKKLKRTPPPPAYDLTELQRDANKKYAYSAKETLGYMQSLYERHKVLTYPRTDSRYVTDDIVPTLPDRLKGMADGPYRELAYEILRSRPIPTRHIVDNKRVSDHHAIIPTEEQVNLDFLSPQERNIYDLVARRFLAVLSPAFEYEETKITLQANGERFYARGKTVVNPGWKSAYGLSVKDDDDTDELPEQLLPSVKQGDKMTANAINIEAGKTKPPARYTEATLLSAMEHPCGLGTPATRADIIEKLFSTFYVERSGKELVPTSKGMQLIDIVPKDLRSAELTSKWEDELALIAKGQASSDKFIADMRKFATRLVNDVKNSDATYKHDNQTKDVCPDCGKFLLEVKNKKGGLMRVCPDRDCGYRKTITTLTNARCPNCHKKLELRGEGEKRSFFCVCGHRERLSDFEKRKEKGAANKGDVRRYLQNQQKQEEKGETELARQLAKWMEQN